MNGKYTSFCYALEGSSVRRFWQVPHDFVFPKCDQKLGWHYWMMGVPYHQENDRQHAIMPFCLMNPNLLPPKVKNAINVNWLPVYSIMEKSIVSGVSHSIEMSASELESW